MEPLQVRKVDVGRHDVAALTNLFGQPDGHRAPPGADLKASPAWLNEFTPPSREGIENVFQKTQPVVFGFLAPFGVQTVTRPKISGCIWGLDHRDTIVRCSHYCQERQPSDKRRNRVRREKVVVHSGS